MVRIVLKTAPVIMQQSAMCSLVPATAPVDGRERHAVTVG